MQTIVVVVRHYSAYAVAADVAILSSMSKLRRGGRGNACMSSRCLLRTPVLLHGIVRWTAIGVSRGYNAIGLVIGENCGWHNWKALFLAESPPTPSPPPSAPPPPPNPHSVLFSLSFLSTRDVDRCAHQALYRMHQGLTSFRAKKRAAKMISRAWRNGQATSQVK